MRQLDGGSRLPTIVVIPVTSRGTQLKPSQLLAVTLAIVLGSELTFSREAVVAPAAGVEMSTEYLSKVHRSQMPYGRTRAETTYLLMFFSGVTSPRSEIVGARGVAVAAFNAGKAYWFKHPARRREIMLGYGYTEIVIHGKRTTGFEGSLFVPNDQAAQRIWISALDDAKIAVESETGKYLDSVPVKVQGYLSPAGSYGHMGGYDREIFATNISRGGV